MANNDLDDVRLHATQAFEAVERSYNKIGRGKRFLINLSVCLLFFIAGFITCNIFNSIPNEGIIERVAAQPDMPNKCKYRYDRAMEYAIMHECVFGKGVPGSEKTSSRESTIAPAPWKVSKRKSPTRKCSKTTS